MRLPTVGGVDAQVDEPAAKELVDYAMAHGINYYDTAWGYHGGHSEAVMGRCLRQYPRQSYYLASNSLAMTCPTWEKCRRSLKSSCAGAVWNILILSFPQRMRNEH